MAVRPERVPAEEVRQRMLDAGRDLALEAGAALTIEHLRLEEVIQRARVPRSSVYRMWPYKDDYIDDLLCYLAGVGNWFNERPVFDPETVNVLMRVLADNKELLGSMEGRRELLREMVRVTATRNYRALTESLTWRLHMALSATLGSTRSGEARQMIAASLEEAQRVSRESLVKLFGAAVDAIGLRLRNPDATLEHLQLAGGLLVQSMALRNVQVQAASGGEPASGEAAHVDALLNTPLPGPGLHGQTAEWSLAAFAYLGIVDAFVELDPDFTPAPQTPPTPPTSPEPPAPPAPREAP
jgi:AcrR family transcriptional regulator